MEALSRIPCDVCGAVGKHFFCRGCRQLVCWCQGGDDDEPDYCADCWCTVHGFDAEVEATHGSMS